MKVEKIVYTPNVAFSSRKNRHDNNSSTVRHSAKNAALLTAALTALAACTKVDVIDVNQVADEERQKTYKYDTDKDGVISEQEQIDMEKQIKYLTINKLLQHYTYEDTTRGNADIRKLNHEELIELLQKYPNIMYLQTLNPDTSRGIVKKLVDYRIKKLSPEFVPMDNFAEKAKLKDSFKFENHITRITKNKKLKEVFADNLAFHFTEVEFGAEYYGNEYRNILIKLLLPEKSDSTDKNFKNSH